MAGDLMSFFLFISLYFSPGELKKEAFSQTHTRDGIFQAP
jgi:hypothetical protein